jgi:hypothetical protein
MLNVISGACYLPSQLSRASANSAERQPCLPGGSGAKAQIGLIGPKGKTAMKSIPLTESQISAIANYLLGTELSIRTALHACYIDAEDEGYFADELDSASQSELEERIFKCGRCDLWSRMHGQARETIRNDGVPACEICGMSSLGISPLRCAVLEGVRNSHRGTQDWSTHGFRKYSV